MLQNLYYHKSVPKKWWNASVVSCCEDCSIPMRESDVLCLKRYHNKVFINSSAYVYCYNSHGYDHNCTVQDLDGEQIEVVL